MMKTDSLNIFRPVRSGGFFIAIVVFLGFLAIASAICRADDTVDVRFLSVAGTWKVELFPAGRLYDAYIGDPTRPGFSMTRMFIRDSDVPAVGESIYSFMLGGQHGLLKLRRSDYSDLTFQIDVYASFLGQFDRDNSFDNIGWDGLFGYMATLSNGGGLSLKLAMQHDSSHVGDEYMERTGRRRINYTREEIVFGMSYRFPQYFRIYGETGYAQDLRNEELQEPWRLKGGVEFEDRDRFFGGRIGYYSAFDLTFMEENSWDADITVQAGIVLPVRQSAMAVRFGPIYRNGRPLIGEFLQYREEWWGMALWVDF